MMTAMARAGSRRQFDKALLWTINVFVIFWLIGTSGAIFPLLAIGSSGEVSFDEAARSKLRLLLLPGLLLAPFLALIRFRGIATLLLRNGFLLMLLLWITVSVTWTLAPEVTGRRIVSLLANTLIVCFLVVDRDIKQILQLFSWIMLILLLASVAFILLRPELGMMPDGRGLRGAFTHKNLLGETVVVSLIVFFAALKGGAISRWMGLFGYGLALALLVPAGAASSIVVGFVIIGLHAFFLTDVLSPQQRAVLVSFGVSIILVAGGVLFTNLDEALGLLGRDTTLTGRTDIWSFVLSKISERPWLGYGFTAFFETQRFGRYVLDGFGWSIPTAHNGYLETVLGLGWIGLAILLCYIGTMAYRLAVRFRAYSPALFMFSMPVLVYYCGINLTESTMLGPSGISWLTMALASLMLTPGFHAGPGISESEGASR
jgi:O-antigen ligase